MISITPPIMKHIFALPGLLDLPHMIPNIIQNMATATTSGKKHITITII